MPDSIPKRSFGKLRSVTQTSAGNSCKSGYVTITSLLRSVPLFGWEPFLRPGLRMQRRAERKGCQGWPSR